MVNGFKGGDWNEITQTMNVRQKHAHSWVEAYIGRGPENLPIWVTLDPTPGEERDESVAKVGGIAGNFRTFTDVFRHVWIFYIVGYDGDRQSRLLYAPMKQMINWLKEKYLELGKLLRKGFEVLFHFQDISAFISIRGFVVSFLVLSLLAGLAHLSIRLGRRLLRWLRGPGDDSASLSAGILFYRRLAHLLSRLELERTPAETQAEFAARRGPVPLRPRPAGASGRGRAATGGRRLLPRPVRPSRARAGLAPGARLAARCPRGEPWKTVGGR